MSKQYTSAEIHGIAGYYSLLTGLRTCRPQAIAFSMVIIFFALFLPGMASAIIGVIGVIWFIEPFFIWLKPWYIYLNMLTSLIPGVLFIIVAIVLVAPVNMVASTLLIGIGLFSLWSGTMFALSYKRLIKIARLSPTAEDIAYITREKNAIWDDGSSISITLQNLATITLKMRIADDIIFVVGPKASHIWAYTRDEISISPLKDIDQDRIKASFTFLKNKSKGAISQIDYEIFTEWKAASAASM